MASTPQFFGQPPKPVWIAVASARGSFKASTIQTVVLAILVGLCLLYYVAHIDKIRYPGPWLARCSAWPNWYHAVKGDRHRWLHEQHMRHGPVVQFAPNAVSINTVDGRDAIYRSSTANVKKADWYQTVRDSAGGFLSTFTARDKIQHSTKRRLLSHAFSDRALKDYEPRIVGRVRVWLDILEAQARAEHHGVDMGSWGTLLIFDILGELCFGKTLGLMESSAERGITDLVPQTTGSWYTLGYHPLTKFLRHFLFQTRLGRYVAGRVYGNNARFRAYCLQKFQERSKRGSSVRGSGVDVEGLDIFDYLLHGRETENGQTYTVGDMACETVLLMVAGTQSASCALAATIFYLVNNPGHLTRLEQEVRQAFATEQDIRYVAGQKLATLPLLRACLQESMRLSPPTPGHLPREVELGGLDVDKTYFPPGVDVGTSPYAIHRNPTYFENPDAFNPDRWLTTTTTTTVDDLKKTTGSNTLQHAFHAFSTGPTGCIGKHLAYIELSVAVAHLVWRFDLSVPSPAGPMAEYEMRDEFVGHGQGPVVQLGLKSRA